MAEPIPFPEANTIHRGHGDVLDMHTHVTPEQTISCWKFTKPELAEIARTGRVWVHSMNYGHPLQPQAVSAFKPFTPAEPRS